MDRSTQVRQFLLDQMSDEAREEFEQELLGDSGLYEAVRAHDEGLLESWLEGSLPRSESEPLKARLLSSREGQEQIALALALREKAALQISPESSRLPQASEEQRQPAGSLSFWRRCWRWAEAHPHAWATAAAAFAALAVGLPMQIQQSALQTENARLAAEPAEPITAPASAQAPVKMTFTLEPLFRSEGSAPSLRPPASTQLIELWLKTEYPSG
ncbi:MAG: hypothetical protein AAF725_24935, partial [Acidobacteriota bacterium]